MTVHITQKSGLRQILENVARAKAQGSDGLNLSIGNPAHIPQIADIWRDLAHRSLDADFDTAMGEYGSAGGNGDLIDELITYFRSNLGWELGPENFVVAPGSQALCDLAVRTFCGPTKPLVLPFLPDYAGYMGLGGGYAKTHGFATQLRSDGPRAFSYVPDFAKIETVQEVGMYLYSDPSNPSAYALDETERTKLIGIAAKRGAMVVVDNAYGAPFPMLAPPKSAPVFDPNVINLFSCSKMGLPGARLGFAIGPADRITQLNSAVSNAVLQGPGLPQRMLWLALSESVLDRRITQLITPHYAEKRAVAMQTLHRTFPTDVPWSVCSGTGGMFVWLRIDAPWFDDLEFYSAAERAGVFVTPGRFFFNGTHDENLSQRKFIRLSLSAPTHELTRGLEKLGIVLDEMWSSAHRTAPAFATM